MIIDAYEYLNRGDLIEALATLPDLEIVPELTEDCILEEEPKIVQTRLLPDWLEAFMTYTDNTEPPDMFRIWTGIFTISACLKRKCVLLWGTETFYPNLYVVLVGPSAARKGTAMKFGYSMLSDINVKLAADSTTRESLIRELNRTAGDTDVSPEGKLELHSSLVIFSKELSVFLGHNNIALMSDLTDWYDCPSRWNYSTKDKALSDDVVNVWVALFGATTPKMVQINLPLEVVGLGLASRIIFVMEHDKGKSVPAPFLTQHQIELRELLLRDLEQILMLRGQFKYTRKFLETYIEWYIEQDANPPFKDERLSGYNGRRANHLLKLSMVISASRSNNMVITDQDMLRALDILTKTEIKMPLVFSGMGMNPLGPVLHRAMMILSRKSEITYNELATILSNDTDTMGLDKIIRSMEASNFARLEITGKDRVIRRISDTVPFV